MKRGLDEKRIDERIIDENDEKKKHAIERTKCRVCVCVWVCRDCYARVCSYMELSGVRDYCNAT